MRSIFGVRVTRHRFHRALIKSMPYESGDESPHSKDASRPTPLGNFASNAEGRDRRGMVHPSSFRLHPLLSGVYGDHLHEH